MDPKDKELADLKDQVAKLTTQVTTVTGERDVAVKERDVAKGDVTKLGADLKKKDDIIDQKNKDIVGARREYKKLADMTQEEKDQLTAAELELKERQETFEADQKVFKETQLAEQKKQTDARLGGILGRMAGNKPEIVAKLRENWGKLDRSLTEKATTEDEISKLATDAWNMLGTVKPDPVRAAVGGAGGEPGGEGKTDFTETPDGKALAATLNIDVGQNEKK